MIVHSVKSPPFAWSSDRDSYVASVERATVRAMKARTLEQLLASLCDHIGDDVLRREAMKRLATLASEVGNAARDSIVLADHDGQALRDLPALPAEPVRA